MIYFVQPVDGGPVKIGRTSGSMGVRLAALQCGSPVTLRCLGTIDGGWAEEAQLHRHFADDRLHGEWFSPTGELVDLIRAGVREPRVTYAVHGNPVSDGRRMPPGRWWPFARQVLASLDAAQWRSAAELRRPLSLEPADHRLGTCLSHLHARGWIERATATRRDGATIVKVWRLRGTAA